MTRFNKKCANLPHAAALNNEFLMLARRAGENNQVIRTDGLPQRGLGLMKNDLMLKAQAGARALKFMARNGIADAEGALANDPTVKAFVQKALLGGSGADDLPPAATDSVAINLAAALVSDTLVPVLIAAGAVVSEVNTPVNGISAVGAGWVGEGKQTPAVRLAAEGIDRLRPFKVAAIAVVTEEVARQTSAESNAALIQALADSTAIAVDKSLLDDTAGSDERPAGLLNGAAVASANTLSAVLALHAENNPLRGTVIIMDATTATAGFDTLNDTGAALMRLGIALHFTSADLGGRIVAINAHRIVTTPPATTADQSRSASVEMVDAGAQNSLDGSGAAEMVSMFQTNSVAMRAATWLDVRTIGNGVVTVGAAA